MDPGLFSSCSTSYLVLKRDQITNIRYRSVPLRCHSWSCPVCAKDKAEKYKVRMRPLFARENLHMYTFTYFHSKPEEEVWCEYQSAWNRLRTAIVKRFGTVHYCRVLESHKESNYPHLHVIMDKLVPPTWLNKELLSAGFGYQCDVKQVRDDQAGRYISKYLTKVWTNEKSAQIRRRLRLRIISFSAGVCTRLPGPSGWHLVGIESSMEGAIDKIKIDATWSEAIEGGETCTKEYSEYYETVFTYKEARNGT